MNRPVIETIKEFGPMSTQILQTGMLSENQSEDESEAERKGRQSGKYKKICASDPDATMATNARNLRLEPAYKQHTPDDKVDVILDVAVTTGQKTGR